VGTAELVVVGVLNLIAKGMAISASTAGTLVSAYALGVSIGGPLLAAVSIRLSRRNLLWLSMAGYVVGNLLAAVAANFGMLVVVRALAGSLHGLFIGVAFAVGVGLVPRDRMGRAISVVLGGITVSHVIGVPIGTLMGQSLGWPAAFATVVVLGVIALAAALLFVPQVANTGVGGFAAQARYALAPRVLAVLLIAFLLLGGQFAALTYLTPFLANVTGISGGLVSAFLLAYGIANAAGTFIGGWAADRSAARTLIGANVLLIVALGMLYLVGSVPFLVVLALCLCGLTGFGLVPSLQYRVVSLAGPVRDVAATLPASAANAGIAVGALVGGWALAHHGPSAPVLAGMVICAIAVPVTCLTALLRVPAIAADTREPVARLVPAAESTPLASG
jgi:MFS transporter, DHA1 family, inner membrane transport protein